MIDEGQLDERLAELERARSWSPRVIAKLEALLHTPDEESLVRINPLTFARERGVASNEALDLFLHAARLGLLAMEWHLLCPQCGAAVESFASLRGVHSLYFCAMCNLRAEANLDDYIQVSFTVAPSVRRIRFHDLPSLGALEALVKVHFTREMHIGSVDGPRLAELVPQFLRYLSWVAPGERLAFHLEVEEEGLMMMAEFHSHSGAICAVRADAPTSTIDVVIGERELTTSTESVRPGSITGTVENRRARPVIFGAAYHSNTEMQGGAPVTVLEPIVTGAMLLANQTFRRLFRAETVHGQEGLGVRDVTILFTDLKGSTALYQRIGDLKAFTLVQQHFERLADAIQRHGGAIVKTIGDAVMAAFTRPIDAVSAALEMHARIEAFNREHATREIVLKIGIHRGPSIAVTLNESLDYFGHTVNVAARVQGLADADQIYVTDDVHRGEGVAAALAGAVAEDVQLRGVEGTVRVHRASVPR